MKETQSPEHTSSTKTKPPVGETKVRKDDTTTAPSEPTDAQLLKKGIEAAKNAPTTPAEKIAALKAKVHGGSYNVDAAKIAEKLVDEYLAVDAPNEKKR